MSKRGELAKATLLKNLRAVIERMPKLDLPANIVAVYAFGGILREKDKLHDCDLVFLYSMTQNQILRWEKFQDNFSTYGLEANHGRSPIAELEETFAPFIKQGIPLQKAANGEIATILEQKGIPSSWAGCFSWTELFRGDHGDGIFYPDLSRIIRRILIGRRVRGLQAQIRSYDDFMNGRTRLVAKNYVLAWSPEKPSPEENIEGRSLQDRKNTIIKELDFFINDQIPQYINGSQSYTGYLKAKELVRERSNKAGLKKDLNALDRQHVEIKHTGDESYQVLLQKCELARNEMRKYNHETIVLKEIANALERWANVQNDSYYQRHPKEDCVAYWVIRGIRKNDVKEEDIRRILGILNLPENHIITIKGYGFTDYRFSKNEKDRQNFLREAELERLRKKYIQSIMKTIRPLEKDVSIKLELNENREPKLLVLEICRQVEPTAETERNTIIEKLRARNFETKNYSWTIYATKKADLTGKENIKELRDLAKRMLAI